MAKRIDGDDILTSFAQWEFTKQEELIAHSFSELQIQRLVTLRTAMSAQKLNQTFDVENAAALNRDIAWLDGRITLITELLSDHFSAQAEIESQANKSA